MLVGVITYKRLQYRSGELEGESDQSDFGERQVVVFLEDRIYRRDDGLNQVVEQVRKTDGEQYGEQRFLNDVFVVVCFGGFHLKIVEDEIPDGQCDEREWYAHTDHHTAEFGFEAVGG